MNEKGFTIIELGIVIAIIGILAAIAIPQASAAGVLYGFFFLIFCLGSLWLSFGAVAVFLTLKWTTGKKTLMFDDILDLLFTALQGPFSLFGVIATKRRRDLRDGKAKPFEIKNPFYKEKA